MGLFNLMIMGSISFSVFAGPIPIPGHESGDGINSFKQESESYRRSFDLLTDSLGKFDEENHQETLTKHSKDIISPIIKHFPSNDEEEAEKSKTPEESVNLSTEDILIKMKIITGELFGDRSSKVLFRESVHLHYNLKSRMLARIKNKYRTDEKNLTHVAEGKSLILLPKKGHIKTQTGLNLDDKIFCYLIAEVRPIKNGELKKLNSLQLKSILGGEQLTSTEQIKLVGTTSAKCVRNSPGAKPESVFLTNKLQGGIYLNHPKQQNESWYYLSE